MADEYIRKQDAVDAFNRAVQDVGILDADDIETVFGMLSPADVVPVVHGRWENYGPVTIKCSRCGHVIHDWRYSECKYCPNCGAKMDGKGEE